MAVRQRFEDVNLALEIFKELCSKQLFTLDCLYCYLLVRFLCKDSRFKA
jgi:hypothetical protein